ncbi:Cog3 [Trypoxylus dichotomus]
MDTPRSEENTTEQIVQRNIAKWQDVNHPLAPLAEEQMDIVYQIEDSIKYMFYKQDTQKLTNAEDNAIYTQNDFIKWIAKVESQIKDEDDIGSHVQYDKLQKQSKDCHELYNFTYDVINVLRELETKYKQVTTKTDSMHILSEELMRHQTQLKEKKRNIQEKLYYFTLYQSLDDNINVHPINVNTIEFCNMLDEIDQALIYLNDHQNFKESYSYRIKYENLLVVALQNVLKTVTQIITVATSQVVNLDNKSLLNIEAKSQIPNIDSAFSFYYGKFQNAASKISVVMNHIEMKIQKNDMYKRILIDCQKAYFSQRTPIMMAAVLKALIDLKNNHKNDHSILFRSAGLFVIKVCQDETACFRYFFNKPSPQLDEYLGTICQNLYDILRPCLIGINHLEVLTELCTILKQMLNDQIQNNVALDQFVETIKQLVQDVEERLVFRANIFFQHDLLKYDPSPGDLAYPEKLQQMENIAEEISDRRSDSRTSSFSIDLQDAVNLNTNYLGQFRSYTGNSPADLHGMWYPTVKRTLVCLSRLYFCLDKEIFQGLAQEALIICTTTINAAAEKITLKKTVLDGKLFQIKHLLIIREQIAPFQVDFTVKEMGLDFSTLKTAAVGLLQKRDKFFSFSSNNAFLEFILEGTPKVVEYLIDSRKEIDKELKAACEAFILSATNSLIGDVTQWIQKAEHILNLINNSPNNKSLSLKEQEFARAQNLANVIVQTTRNVKAKIPEIQRSMKLYLANKETEFILFRPIKNNILNSFMQLEQILVAGKYTQEEQLLVACPSTEQLNILICSVSLTMEQERLITSRASHSRYSDVTN